MIPTFAFFLGAFLGIIGGATLYRAWLDYEQERVNKFTPDDGVDNVINLMRFSPERK